MRGCFLVFFAFFILLFSLTLGSILLYVDGIPAISNFVVNRLPISVDQQVGRKVSTEIEKSAPIDKNKTELLNAFFHELHFDGDTKLYVVKANEFNAFALPDNSIFVFDNVLRNINSYQELAALLGHEYAHIKLRHGMKGIAQEVSWRLLAGVLSGDDNADNFLNNSNLLLSLRNQREFETQADLLGLQLLREQQIDQNGMKSLFQTMLKLQNDHLSEPPVYLSTHPKTEDRLKRVDELIRKKPTVGKVHITLQGIFDQLQA